MQIFGHSCHISLLTYLATKLLGSFYQALGSGTYIVNYSNVLVLMCACVHACVRACAR